MQIINIADPPMGGINPKANPISQPTSKRSEDPPQADQTGHESRFIQNEPNLKLTLVIPAKEGIHYEIPFTRYENIQNKPNQTLFNHLNRNLLSSLKSARVGTSSPGRVKMGRNVPKKPKKTVKLGKKA